MKGPTFLDDIFRYAISNANICILIHISPKFVLDYLVDNKSALVQVMAWRRTGAKPIPGLILNIMYDTLWRHKADADQRKHQSSASLAFVRWIHRGPVNSPHKWPVTRKMFPFYDVIMTFHGKQHTCYKCETQRVNGHTQHMFET